MSGIIFIRKQPAAGYSEDDDEKAGLVIKKENTQSNRFSDIMIAFAEG
jgi:hypothetical protein